jgi:hypothetical protein
MEEQTDMQLDQIRQQIELLAEQARKIQERKELSLKIYQAKMNFAPLMGSTYYLYETEEGGYILSMIGPDEWGRARRFKNFVSKVKLLADHTWSMES